MAHSPFPLQSGNSIVAYFSLKSLATNHTISLISPQPINTQEFQASFIQKIQFVKTECRSFPGKWLNYFFSLMRGIPPSVAAHSSKAMIRCVKSEILTEDYDVILLFDLAAIQFCPPSEFRKTVINIEDPQSIKLERMSKLKIWTFSQWVRLIVATHLTNIYERRYLARMQKVFLLSAADAADMEELGGYKNLVYIPYGVTQKPDNEILDFQKRTLAIVYSGNMFHPPNVDGCMFLLNEIFPKVLEEDDSAVLWIVGDRPDIRIIEAAKRFGDRVVVTGRVDDVGDYIRRSVVSICPVRLKIGIQTKILEALSWGTPVVTTGAGNGGIGGVSGTHLWVEDDVGMLAKRICELLRGQNWDKFSAEGRRFVAESYAWEQTATQIEHHLLGVAEQNT